MEIDQTIALLQKEYRGREEREERQRKIDLHDPRENITYTLEQLIAGIKSGEQYIYTLKLLFETRAVMDGQWTIPFILDFFDFEKDDATNVLLVNNQRNTSMAAVTIPMETIMLPLENWVPRSIEALKGQNLHVRQVKAQAVNQMEYFCYELPTSESRMYNVQFRIIKNEQMCVGGFCCKLDDKEGMGLLMEAMVYVMEEMNR